MGDQTDGRIAALLVLLAKGKDTMAVMVVEGERMKDTEEGMSMAHAVHALTERCMGAYSGRGNPVRMRWM
jgi:hypothetical protein